MTPSKTPNYSSLLAPKSAARRAGSTCCLIPENNGVYYEDRNEWRKREETNDLPMGPKKIKSTVLSEAKEQAIVTIRKMTGLPLDDVLYSLQETIPHLTRSSLHRCHKRHGCSVLPDLNLLVFRKYLCLQQ